MSAIAEFFKSLISFLSVYPMDFHKVGENLKSDPEENLRSYWEATGKYMRIALDNEQMRQELLQAQALEEQRAQAAEDQRTPTNK